MRYGFDSLFENFRNAIEQVLAEEYNGDLTNQKTYEVIKKYNQLSSYLKNIMNMKQLSDKDQEEIQVKFNELKDKLNLLKKIAIDNQFLDSDDIVDMVDKINNVTTDKRQEMKSVPATSAKMVKTLENKSDMERMIGESGLKLDELEKRLNDEEVSKLKKLPDFRKRFEKLNEFFTDPELTLQEYSSIKEYYDGLITLDNDISSALKEIDETRDKIDIEIIKLDEILENRDAKIDTFFQGIFDNVKSKLDMIKNKMIQVINDDFAKGLILAEDAEEEIKNINDAYDKEYYDEVLDKVSQGLYYIQSKEYKKFEPEVKFYNESHEELRDGDVLSGMTETELDKISSILDKTKTKIINGDEEIRKQSMNYFDGIKELQYRNVEKKEEKEEKEVKEEKEEKEEKEVKEVKVKKVEKVKKVKKAEPDPDKIPLVNGNNAFLTFYKSNVSKYLNGTEYTTFPKYLFKYIKRGGDAKTNKDILVRITNASTKGLYGAYVKLTPENRKAYFT